MNARECIGNYGGIKIDDEQKEKFMNNLTNYCEKPSAIIYVLFVIAWVMILPALAIGISMVFVDYNQIIFGLLFCILLVGDFALIAYTGGVKKVFLYDNWKKDCKAIKNHDVFKIKVEPAMHVASSNFHKSKYITLNINSDIYDDFFEIPDDVYDDLAKYDFYAYYFEYTQRERRANKYLFQYGIYIIATKRDIL